MTSHAVKETKSRASATSETTLKLRQSAESSEETSDAGLDTCATRTHIVTASNTFMADAWFSDDQHDVDTRRRRISGRFNIRIATETAE